MVNVDHSEPADIVDRLLWRDAQTMLGRHADADDDGRCGWCGWHWPCAPRRLAERAAEAARSPWREAWTTRHDLNSMRALPGLRAELPGRSAGHGPAEPASRDRRARHSWTNRGLFR
ncbi:MAG TPA: hypothetical protein VF755_20445 [Catenuloplanes sp.]|jgi:hypothetical protein